MVRNSVRFIYYYMIKFIY